MFILSLGKETQRYNNDIVVKNKIRLIGLTKN